MPNSGRNDARQRKPFGYEINPLNIPPSVSNALDWAALIYNPLHAPVADAGSDISVAPIVTPPCGNTFVQLGTPNSNSYNYQWSSNFVDGTLDALNNLICSICDETFLYYSFPATGLTPDGEYVYSSYGMVYYLTVTDPSTMCSSVDEVVVQLVACRHANLSNPDFDEDQQEEFSIFPNPSINFINFKNNNYFDQECRLRLYDDLGRLNKEIPFKGKAGIIDLGNVKSNLYLYIVINSEGEILYKGYLIVNEI